MFGNEIRFKIGGDVAQLERSFTRAEGIAERSGRKMESSVNKSLRALRAPGEGESETRKRLAADAAIERRQEAQVKLAQARKRIAYEEATTVGKIKIVTAELADLAKRRAKEEEGSTGYLRIQLGMEERMAKLRTLQQQQQAANLPAGGLGGKPVASDGGDGGFFGRMRMSLPTLIARAVGGAITGGLTGLLGMQQSRQRVAEAQEASTGESLDSMRARIAAMKGLAGEVDQGYKKTRDLNEELARLRAREKELSEGLLAKGVDFLTKMGLAPDELTKTQEKIQGIGAEIQKVGDATQMAEREFSRQSAIRDATLGRGGVDRPGTNRRGPGGARDIGTVVIGPDIGAIPETERAQRKGTLNELTRATIELRRLGRLLVAEQKYGTPESVRDAKAAVRMQQMAVGEARMHMRQRLLEVQQQLTATAAQGRTFADGRPRPRSEAERIAQRAQEFRDRAQALVLTQARGLKAPGTVGGVGSLITAAKRDEAELGRRFQAGSAQTPRDKVSDATALRPELVKSNQLLGAIKESLQVIEVGDIRR
jgi:hypothetical protein